MTFNELIKMYLEKQCQTDEALAAVYDESKVKGACDYIRKQAQKQAVSGCAMIEDEIVFKWARDFMYGDIEQEENKPIVKPGKTDTSHAPSDDVPLDGEKSDTNYTKPFVKKTAIVEKKPAADDPRQLNLFDFGGDE